MGELISTIFSSFTEVMTGLAGGLSSAFNHLLYVYDAQGAQTEAFSPLVLFIFTMAGVSLGAGILWGIFRLIRGSSHRAG